jgi:flagellar hook protein FlgE
MSVFGALFSGVSGLGANSNALGMIADNITNVNTVGYKNTVARFSTLVTEASSTTIYSPGGVKAAPLTLVDKQGLLQSSESATDLGIVGAGFFVVTNNPSSISSENIQFTRAGSFTPDADGFLRNAGGLYLKGWPIDANGNIPSNLGDLNTLETINVSGLTGIAEATTQAKMRVNLQSSLPTSAAVSSYDPTSSASNMASGAVTPDFERNIQVFDAQGSTKTLTIGFLKKDFSTNPNEWFVEVYANPASDVNVTAPAVDGQIATGTLAFNPDGTYNAAGTSAALKSAMAIDWTSGAANSSITFNWGTDGLGDGFTQFDSLSTLISSSVNGAIFGNVEGVRISENGEVTALFDNGLVKKVAQLPLATFQNPNALTRRNGNSFTRSDGSGAFNMQIPGSGGAGLIAPSTLEASTVDLAEEFTKLITTQRGFSAASRIITTADEMLNELNQLKR